MSLFHHSNGLFPSYFNQNLQPRTVPGAGEATSTPPCYHNESPHLWPSPSPPNFQSVASNNQPTQQQHSSAMGSSHQFPYTQLPSAAEVGSYPMDHSPLGNGYNLGVGNGSADCSRDLDYTVSSTGGSPVGAGSSQYDNPNIGEPDHWQQHTNTNTSAENRKKTVEYKGEISYR